MYISSGGELPSPSSSSFSSSSTYKAIRANDAHKFLSPSLAWSRILHSYESKRRNSTHKVFFLVFFFF